MFSECTMCCCSQHAGSETAPSLLCLGFNWGVCPHAEKMFVRQNELKATMLLLLQGMRSLLAITCSSGALAKVTINNSRDDLRPYTPGSIYPNSSAEEPAGSCPEVGQ